MSLTARTISVNEVRADTSNFVQNMNKGRKSVDSMRASTDKGKLSLIALNQGVQLFGTALRGINSVMASVNTLMDQQGMWYSQLGESGPEAAAALAAVNSEVDHMVGSMALLRARNTLVKGDLGLLESQYHAVAKAAVVMSRKTTDSSDVILKKLTQAINTGAVSGLQKYGIQLEVTGTMEEKQQRIIKALSERYGDLKVSVGDAGEEMAKTANKSKELAMRSAKQLEHYSMKWSRFKASALETGAQWADELFGTSISYSNHLI